MLKDNLAMLGFRLTIIWSVTQSPNHWPTIALQFCKPEGGIPFQIDPWLQIALTLKLCEFNSSHALSIPEHHLTLWKHTQFSDKLHMKHTTVSHSYVYG